MMSDIIAGNIVKNVGFAVIRSEDGRWTKNGRQLPWISWIREKKGRNWYVTLHIGRLGFFIGYER
jgi:hypothetical protein